MTGKLCPKDHAERLALFRVQVLGPVLNRELQRGELMAELRELSQRRFRPPDSPRTRTFSVVTLLRWYRMYKREGIAGLQPHSKRQGDALTITAELRELLLEIRRQHRSVPANVILQTLEGDGRLDRGLVSAQTLRRLYRNEGLARLVKAKTARTEGERRRWEASYVGEIWHADVCHGSRLQVGDRRIPVRIHALMDDKSRYVPVLSVLDHEREIGMLELLLEAFRLYEGGPSTLYLDNGSTYRRDALETVCGRLGIKLVHARPYDPQARGKMERWWRTLREGCLDLMKPQASLHDVQIRLSAFVASHYHKRPHASLVGRSPAQEWVNRRLVAFSEAALCDALTLRETRRVGSDCTLSIGNVDWEVVDSFFAGRNVTIARSLASPQSPPWVEHEGRRYELRLVDPVANGKLGKRRRPKPGIDAVDFDPAEVLLRRYTGQLRTPRKDGES